MKQKPNPPPPKKKIQTNKQTKEKTKTNCKMFAVKDQYVKIKFTRKCEN